MAKPQLRNNFIPLSDAHWKFAPHRLKEMYWKLSDLPAPRNPDPRSATIVQVLQLITEQLRHMARAEPAIKEMREHVVEMLRRSYMEARGINTALDVRDKQETIPHFYFHNAKIEWENNIIESLGYRFAAVEVRRVQKEEIISKQESLEHPSPAPPMKASVEHKRGRPSKEHMIIGAIRQLEGQGIDLETCSKKAAYCLILEQLHSAGCDITKGFSEPVLNRCLNRYFPQK
jgi:hypothetical protein